MENYKALTKISLNKCEHPTVKYRVVLFIAKTRII